MSVSSAVILPVNELAAIALVGMAGGLYLFFRGFKLLARKRLLLNTPTSRIRSAAMGLVEVSGLATGPYTIPAPITGRSCYLYRTTAWQLRDSRNNREWEKVAEESLHVPFFLDDNTGKLLVDPHGAELELHRDFREEYTVSSFSAQDLLPAPVGEFLARNGVNPSRRLRIEECAIKPKNALFIVGTLSENPGYTARPFVISDQETLPPGVSADWGQRSWENAPATEIVRLSDHRKPSSAAEMTQQAKIAAALNKAGILQPEAYVAAGVSKSAAAAQPAPRVQQFSVNGGEVPGASERNPEFDLTPPTVLMRAENNPTFLISWRSQHAILRSLAWRSAAMIWGGGVLAILALYVLLAQWALV